jgi:hypothetical protein
MKQRLRRSGRATARELMARRTRRKLEQTEQVYGVDEDGSDFEPEHAEATDSNDSDFSADPIVVSSSSSSPSSSDDESAAHGVALDRPDTPPPRAKRRRAPSTRAGKRRALAGGGFVCAHLVADVPTADPPPLADTPPAGLAVTLLPFQLEALAWMRAQEASPVRGGILADEQGMGITPPPPVVMA